MLISVELYIMDDEPHADGNLYERSQLTTNSCTYIMMQSHKMRMNCAGLRRSTDGFANLFYLSGYLDLRNRQNTRRIWIRNHWSFRISSLTGFSEPWVVSNTPNPWPSICLVRVIAPHQWASETIKWKSISAKTTTCPHDIWPEVL